MDLRRASPPPRQARTADAAEEVVKEGLVVGMKARLINLTGHQHNGKVVTVVDRHTDGEHWIVTLQGDPDGEPEAFGVTADNLAEVVDAAELQGDSSATEIRSVRATQLAVAMENLPKALRDEFSLCFKAISGGAESLSKDAIVAEHGHHFYNFW